MNAKLMQARSSTTMALVVTTVLVAGCGSPDQPASPAVGMDPRPNVTTDVTGCIKGGDAEGQWVLAAARREEAAAIDRTLRGQATTYGYILEAPGQDLSQYVGREITVTGVVIEDIDDVEVEKSREMTGEPTVARDGREVTPTVEIEEEALIDLRRMRVETVTLTGNACEMLDDPAAGQPTQQMQQQQGTGAAKAPAKQPAKAKGKAKN
jgi:hypothetical protein